MLTDYYQITMGYAYWKAGKMDDIATFDLYFRKNPFKGEFTIFAGLEECLRLLTNFRFTAEDTAYLKTQLPGYVEDGFYRYLEDLDTSKLIVHAIDEGSVVFPKVPLIRIEGPLILVQLLETPFLTLVNFASLVCTNAARHRIAVGDSIQLLEFGLRRAQGPDGGLSASRYCYMGGFDATSNVLAGQTFGIPIKGTHAHAFVTSFGPNGESSPMVVPHADGKTEGTSDFLTLCQQKKDLVTRLGSDLGVMTDPNPGELAAFATYAFSFPKGFLALVDTYDVMKSGLPNYCAVALALNDLGYRAIGIRLDSGDLAYLSVACRDYLRAVGRKIDGFDWIGDTAIVASNNINEETLYSLKNQGHEINVFGVGTHLVTCQAQPALGCVFKLVQVNDESRIKLSEDVEKVTLPGSKAGWRLYGRDGLAIVDLIQPSSTPAPAIGKRILCRHPFIESKRAHVVPTKVEQLHHLYFSDGKIQREFPSLPALRKKVLDSVRFLRSDHIRALNPTPYKVSVSEELYQHMHTLWLDNAPVGELF